MNTASNAILCLSLVSLSACADDATTTGKRIDLEVQAKLGSPQSFTTATGWTVELSKLIVSSGPVYFYEGAAIEAEGSALRRGLEGIFGVRSAWAHPGHYVPGEARGEMLTPTSFDLLEGPATLGQGEGVTGLFRSATFSFASPAEGPKKADLADLVVVIEGAATLDATTRLFRIEAEKANVLDPEADPAVLGCPFHEATIEASATVVVEIDPSVWLDQAEFADLPESTDGEPVLAGADTIAHRAFVRGVKKSGAYRFSVAK